MQSNKIAVEKVTSSQLKPTFSGHDSFLCKQFWLKKGYDFVNESNSFNEEKAVVKLGVGKNMVSAVHYWMKGFGVLNSKGQLTEIGKFIFDEKKGKDKYIENISTVWLLHYLLVTNNHSSLYNIFFNKFRRERMEFSREHLLAFVTKQLQEDGINLSSNTINSDISVFIRTYIKPSSKNTREGIEEDFSSVLVDLQLMEQIEGRDYEGKKVDYFKIESGLRYDLPASLLLFSILNARPNSKSISFKELYIGKDMPGSVFALSKEGLFTKLEQLKKDYKSQGVTFSENAGIQELQFKKTLDKMEVLNDCY